MISEIDKDTCRQELVDAMVRLAGSKRVRVVAEGIERAAEAETCRRLGCQYGQGFHFGRPEPLPERTIARRHMAAWTNYQAQLQMAHT
jgi:EAL domain-containing protein (putative c-di-GMP-specific phosphodiesterase class I)